MFKAKKLKLNKVTVQNLGTLSDNEAQKVKGGSRVTICYKTCGLECTVILTDLCTRSYCE
ncbi:MAG: hypothetical protein PVH61_37440 [Candidatus Aminicenantes bacterium]|jgi:hypothetical protein